MERRSHSDGAQHLEYVLTNKGCDRQQTVCADCGAVLQAQEITAQSARASLHTELRWRYVTARARTSPDEIAAETALRLSSASAPQRIVLLLFPPRAIGQAMWL